MDLDKTKVVSILGDMNSGKTNLAFHLLRDYKGTRKIYLLGYPRKIDNFTNISNFNDIFTLTDSIIFIDEIQKHIKLYEKKTNQDLLELISLFSHNNNTLIFTTPLSQFITKSVEAFIDGWCLTRIRNTSNLKNGSKGKIILKETAHHSCTRRSLALQDGEYLENCESNSIEKNGVKSFEFQGIEKDWKLRQKSEKVAQKEEIKKVSSEEGIEDFKNICRRWAQRQVSDGKIKIDQCSICEAKANKKNIHKIEIHHKRYAYPFKFEDLMIVCKKCHQKQHGRGITKPVTMTIQTTNQDGN